MTVRSARNLFGVAALLLFVCAANFLILRETLFTRWVLAPLIAAGVLGAISCALWLSGLWRNEGGGEGGPVNAVLASVFLLGSFGVVYAMVARPAWSWDLTQEGRKELSPQTVLVLQSLTMPVDVVCFFVKAGDDRVVLAQDKTRRFLGRCAAVTDQLRISFIDPIEHPEQVEKYNVLGTKKSKVGSILIKADSRQREIPLSGVNARLEEGDFTNALINVARETLPRVYFLTGHGGWDLRAEDPKGGLQFASLLHGESYELAQMAITEDAPSVPADCAVLVINGFTDDLRDFELDAIDQYMRDGGRLLVLINPLYQPPTKLTMVERLRPWLEDRFGLRMPTNVLVSNESKSYQIAFLPDFSMFKDFMDPRGGLEAFRGSYNATHPISHGLDKAVALTFVRSIESAGELPEGVSHAALLRSTPDTWAETDLDAVMNQREISMDDVETRGPNIVAMAATLKSEVDVVDESRSREARAVVVGNADISTNSGIIYVGVQDLLLNSMGWLTASEELTAIRPSRNTDQPIVLTRGQQRTIAWIASLGPVQVIALIGAAVLLWRRRYQ